MILRLLPRTCVFTALLGTVALLVGCAPSAPQAPVEFRAVEVTVSGGVDGRYELLVVQPDGIALRLGRAGVSAGRIAPDTLTRLSDLTTSAAFRRAVADREESSRRCSDVVTTTVRMGADSVSRDDTCGDVPPPVVGEVMTLLDDPWTGRFAEPVGATGPELQVIRLTSTADPERPVALSVTPDGALERAASDRVRRTATIPQQDAIRVLTARIVETGIRACRTERAVYVLAVGSGPARPGCAYADRGREIRALATFVDTAVDG